MKGADNIIDKLNQLLAYELAAMDQYFLHAEMYADWGLTKLYERIAHEFDDEKGHAKKLIERILFLEGIPDMSKRDGLNIGHDVPSMLKSDLAIEYAVDNALKDTMALCEAEKDYVTKGILQDLINDTESDHAHWLEQQIRMIDTIGLSNYLQSQM